MARNLLLVTLFSLLLLGVLAFKPEIKQLKQSKSLNAVIKSVSGAIECSICSWLVGQVQQYVAENKTETEIINLIEGDCSVFGPLSGLCKTLVDNAVPDVVNYLNQNYPPSQICDALSLCGSSASTASTSGSSSSLKPKAPADLTCDICVYLVTQVDTYLENNATIEEIEELLDNDCQIFGPFAGTCIALVDTYLPVIVDYLEQDYTPDQVCNLIDLCSNGTTSTSNTTSATSTSTSTSTSSTTSSHTTSTSSTSSVSSSGSSGHANDTSTAGTSTSITTLAMGFPSKKYKLPRELRKRVGLKKAQKLRHANESRKRKF